MPTTETLSVLHRCTVAPATDVDEHRLPLTYLDLFWLFFHPIKRLLFYQHPCSASHFLQVIVPKLKHSLSQTLRHYLPVAGNLFCPLDSTIPDIRYFNGDSVTLVVAEYSETSNFSYLTGNQPREAEEFHLLVPQLPESRTDSGYKISPLLAIQVTHFPDAGIAIGVTNHHILGDASSIVRFIKAWSSAANLDGEDENLPRPIFDRSFIKDPTNRLNNHWKQLQEIKISEFKAPTPPKKVRATFVLKKNDTEKLKKLVLNKAEDNSIHVSSFTVTIAYFWSCIEKAVAEAGEEIGNDEEVTFGIPVDGRSRMDPPAPAAYFGNCLMFTVAESTHGEMKGKGGFLRAAKIWGEVIRDKVNKKGELLRDSEDLSEIAKKVVGKRSYGVAGSPKFDLYDADFGWGKGVKFEALSIDEGFNVSISLCKSREFEGGLEMGISLPEKMMDAFAAVFHREISNID